jgi:hypothetical protein
MDLQPPFEDPDTQRLDDWWESGVTAPNGRTLTRFVICSENRIRYVLDDTPDGSSTNRTATSTCPDGKFRIGGGAFIATTNSHINASYPTAGNARRARVFDTGAGFGGMQTNATAVCARPARADPTQTVNSQPVSSSALRQRSPIRCAPPVTSSTPSPPSRTSSPPLPKSRSSPVNPST